MPIIVVNPTERDWSCHRYVLWFGAYGPTRLMVWANGLESALETAADWLANNAPGLIMKPDSDEYLDLLKEAAGEHGLTLEQFQALRQGEDDSLICKICESAEADLTYTESGWLTSYEWGIDLEDPDREDVLSLGEACGGFELARS